MISKCEYYLNEFDRKKLTLSNIVFTNSPLNGNHSESEKRILNNNNNTNDDEESMSFIENTVGTEKTPANNKNNLNMSSMNNSSLLPNIE